MHSLDHYAGGAIDVTLRAKYNGCGMLIEKLDGAAFVRVRASDYKDHALVDPEALLDSHFDVTVQTETHHVDVLALTEGSRTSLAITVDDGNIVFTSDSTWNAGSKTGRFNIRDKSHSYACTATDGKASCVADDGGTIQM
jgi:hypothetical protein